MNKKTISSKLQQKILVIDDDPGILDVTKQILEDEGYVVKATADGQTFQEIHTYKPSLILLDIWMSGIDGRNICKVIKSTAATKHIPIIIISANKDTEKIAKEAGANDFIAKPFDIDDLLGIVKKHVK